MMASIARIVSVVSLLILAAPLSFAIEERLDVDADFYLSEQRLEQLQIYFETGMFDQAAELLGQLQLEFPEETRFKYLAGIVDYQRGKYSRAEGVFLKFIEQYPEVVEPYYLLSEINLKKGDSARALEYLAKYCELVPEDLEAHRRMTLLSSTDSRGAVLIEDGREDQELVKKVGFYGGCVHSYQDQTIKLINSTSGGWAEMGIDFAQPIDLRGKRIVLKLRGKRGGEKLILALRDKFASDVQPQLMLNPEKELSENWQDIRVDMKTEDATIDLSQVVHLGLEIGYATADNPFNSILYVEDITIK
ncbi:tetratricopeptide repeat protein [Candidatus Omnitrophota bacterium]